MTSPTEAAGGPENLREARRLADLIHGRLVELGRTVGVAESLTGGMVSALLTEAPGTSATFRGGLVVYATDLKHSLADVSQEDLDAHGPVHEAVAEQLAVGARCRTRADYGLGLTGVAGPGSQGGREVGELFVAVATPDGLSHRHRRLPGSRGDVRTGAAAAALADLLRVLDRENGTAPA